MPVGINLTWRLERKIDWHVIMHLHFQVVLIKTGTLLDVALNPYQVKLHVSNNMVVIYYLTMNKDNSFME